MINTAYIKVKVAEWEIRAWLVNKIWCRVRNQVWDKVEYKVRNQTFLPYTLLENCPRKSLQMIKTYSVLVKWPPLTMANVIRNQVNFQVRNQVTYQVGHEGKKQVYFKVFR